MEGQPHKQKVHRVMKDLQKAKLVEQRRDGHYVLTKNKGEEEAAKTPEKNYMERPAVRAGQYPDPDKNDVGGPSSSIGRAGSRGRFHMARHHSAPSVRSPSLPSI